MDFKIQMIFTSILVFIIGFLVGTGYGANFLSMLGVQLASHAPATTLVNTPAILYSCPPADLALKNFKKNQTFTFKNLSWSPQENVLALPEVIAFQSAQIFRDGNRFRCNYIHQEPATADKKEQYFSKSLILNPPGVGESKEAGMHWTSLAYGLNGVICTAGNPETCVFEIKMPGDKK